MRIKALIGSTQTMFYEFYSSSTGELHDLEDGVIKVFNSSREQINEEEDEPERISTGKYFFKLLVPDSPPHIYIECSGVVDGEEQATRDVIECIWSEDDTNIVPMPELEIGVNTYADLDEANEYFTGSLDVREWYDSAYSQRMRALIAATRRINSLTFKGRKASVDQALAFPRDFSTDIPEPIKQATYEEALEILKQQSNPEASNRLKLQRQGVTRVSFGDASESYGNVGASQDSKRRLFSTEAEILVKPYLASIVRIDN